METIIGQADQAVGVMDLTLLGQQDWLAYVAYCAVVLVGVMLWLGGFRVLRPTIVVYFTLIGLLWGYRSGSYFQMHGVISCLAGGLFGAGLGYFLYRLWLGLLVAGLVIGVSISAVQGNMPWRWIFLPGASSVSSSPSSVAAQHQTARDDDLLKGVGAVLEMANATQSVATELTQTLAGNQGLELKGGDDSFGQLIGDKLEAARRWFVRQKQDVPALELITLGSLILSLVAALLVPQVVGIIFTSLVGFALLAWGTLALFDSAQQWSQAWFDQHGLTAPLLVALGWVVGIAVQYWLVPKQAAGAKNQQDDQGKDNNGKGKKSGGTK